MLGRDRIRWLGSTDYAWEREGLEFLCAALPDRDPYQVWLLGSLPDTHAGRHHDLDAIVLGYHQIYLVEIKSRPGVYRGDAVDWQNELSGEGTWHLDNPFQLTDRKARVLGSRLRDKLAGSPYVQALVFLSAEKVQLDLSPDGRIGVVTRDRLARAITHGEIPGARMNRAPIARPMMRDVVEAMGKVGLRERRSRASVGPYELRELLEEGDGYREYRAVNRNMPSMQRRARVYAAPEQHDGEARSRLERAAQRDVTLLHALAGNPSILHLSDYDAQAAPGPTLLFDELAEGMRLDAYLRAHPQLNFDDRAAIVIAIGQALAACHENKVVHGSLSPQAVLLRKQGDAEPEVRLHNFQLGLGASEGATLHRTTLLGEVASVYQAPEIFEDPAAVATASDLFSLGALAFFVFTGRPPASDAAALRDLLREQGALDPSQITDTLDEDLVAHIIQATSAAPERRAAEWDVATWVERLADIVTAPEATVASDPLAAGEGHRIDGFVVEKSLGRGATSRVKQVRRLEDDQRFALKISADEEHDDRLRAEARVLETLSRAKTPDGRRTIVAFEELLEISGRVCILMRLAGEQTLQKALATEGVLSFADASELGGDLLTALEQLESCGVLHRDIKPANIGYGAPYAGRRKQLTLFDFSAANVPLSAYTVGTAGYRDPFIDLRKKADAAADRYAAAVVLHEMLTGELPSYEGTHLDSEPRLRLAAARFDPSARDALVRFFEQALHHEVHERFATAEAMHASFRRIFETSDHRVAPQQFVIEIQHDTPIAALRLTPRAANALDRAGLVYARDILNLPNNRLRAMRSVGAKVAEEILLFRETLLAKLPPPPVEPFFPDYKGRSLGTYGVYPAELADALRYAGIHDLGALAAAHRPQVEQIIARLEGFEIEHLLGRLEDEHVHAPTSPIPADLAGWLGAFLGPEKRLAHARALFGLEGPLAGRPDANQRDIAKALGVTRQAIHAALKKARARWTKHPAADALVERVQEAVGALGGVATLGELSSRLLMLLAPGQSEPPEAAGSALVRVALEILVERDAGDLLQLIRVHRTPFVCPAGCDVVLRGLGDRADLLAHREVLAAVDAALVPLQEVVASHGAGTPLETMAPPRLVAVAAAASQEAAVSAQLELYPRWMPADRALRHTSAVLPAAPTRADVRERVEKRYPDAARLPEGAALDRLMGELGYVLEPTSGRYRRHQDRGVSLVTTTRSSAVPLTTAMPHEPLRIDEGAVIARDFNERLHIAREQGRFCVLGVPFKQTRVARDRLLREHRLAEVSLDGLLIEAVTTICYEDDLALDDVWEADAAGPGSEEWPELCELMHDAARRVAARLVPAEQPTLLVNPGLIERYDLAEIVAALSGAGEIRAERSSAAIVLLVPTYDASGTPRINDRMPVGNVMGMSEAIPRPWIENADRTAAGK